MSLIELSGVKFTLVHHEEPVKESLYLRAGAPTRCQNPRCEKLFDRACVRGDDDQYYCSELCADEGFDVEAIVVQMRKRTSAT